MVTERHSTFPFTGEISWGGLLIGEITDTFMVFKLPIS